MTLKLEELAYDKAEDIIGKITAQALAGDQFAQRLYFDRILPKNFERPVAFELPIINSAADADAAMQAVIEAVASVELTIAEGERIKGLIEFRLKTLEAKDWERRLENVEKCIEDQ